jgi:polyisoprenoid-binding protein YceI
MRRVCGLLLAMGVAQAGLAQSHTDDLAFDAEHTRFGFELRTTWGQKLQGRFPHHEGRVTVLPDERHQVYLRFFTADVEIEDHPHFTEWARGEHFFNAEKYPEASFVSEPYEPALLLHGGVLNGALSIRGVEKPAMLEVEAASCQRPALDCDVVATGTVSRADYGMDGWGFAINDRVLFVLRARLRENADP